MINQLKAIVGFKEDVEEIETETAATQMSDGEKELENAPKNEGDEDILKTRIEDLNLGSRTQKALAAASIRTVGGLIRKKENDLLDIEGLGEKGVQEIKRALSNFGILLK